MSDNGEFDEYSTWQDNPQIIWYNDEPNSTRGGPELSIFSKSYNKNYNDYSRGLQGPERLATFKKRVLEFHQVKDPQKLARSHAYGVMLVKGWQRRNIHRQLYPPESVNAMIKMYIVEGECHFRWSYYNPSDPIVRFWAEMDNWTSEEEEITRNKTRAVAANAAAAARQRNQTRTGTNNQKAKP